MKSVTTEAVVAEQNTSDREAEQGPAGSLPPHLPAEQDGHLPTPLPPIDPVFKSFRFHASNIPPLIPSLTSSRRGRGRIVPSSKPKQRDPLVTRKPAHHYKALQELSVKRAVWMSAPLLHRVVAAGGFGDSGQGGWVDDVSLFVYFVKGEDGVHTEPTIEYDEDFLLYLDNVTPWGIDTGPANETEEFF